jgi:cyclophilin family peptidyl-prolyl cis-trans isomerase
MGACSNGSCVDGDLGSTSPNNTEEPDEGAFEGGGEQAALLAWEHDVSVGEGSSDVEEQDSDAVQEEDGTPQFAIGNEFATVTFVTEFGEFTIQLNSEKAPITTVNFLQYVESGFYDGDDGLGATVFHRVISGFMVQGGGHTSNLEQKLTMQPIVNESNNGLLNVRGSVAMARTNDPNSATSQFFVNHENNDFLNYVSSTEPGYAVFGEVIEGMDVIDAIAGVPTGMHPGTGMGDVPFEPIEIMDVVTGQ